MAEYFERYGARPLLPYENPAEYILEAIGAGVGAKPTTIDWKTEWAESNERKAVLEELKRLEEEGKTKPHPKDTPREFATSQFYQSWELYKRLNLVWWRNPSYK